MIIPWMPHFLPMITLMVVAAFTPGPNNIMLAASGANFGFRRTIPHLLGVPSGFLFMLALAGVGLDWLFALSPLIQQGFRVAALVFIFWLAWRIATSTQASKEEGRSRPQYFVEAAAFQFINPKGVVMAITVISSFISPDHDYFTQFLMVMMCFTLVTLMAVLCWAGFGVMIRGLIDTPLRLRVFNITMAALLIGSIMPVMAELIS